MHGDLSHMYCSASPGQSSVCSAQLRCRWTRGCCCATGCSPRSDKPSPDAAGPVSGVSAASPAPAMTPRRQTTRDPSRPGCPGSPFSPTGPSSEPCGSLEVPTAGGRWRTSGWTGPCAGGWEAEAAACRSSPGCR